jgi:hypothetical protein
MGKPKFSIGTKVNIPTTKSRGDTRIEESSVVKRATKLGQKFLYVIEYYARANQDHPKKTYALNYVMEPYSGDFFGEEDLTIYRDKVDNWRGVINEQV